MKITKVNYVDVDKNTVFLKNVKKIGYTDDVRNDLLACGVNKMIVDEAIREYKSGISMFRFDEDSIIISYSNKRILERLSRKYFGCFVYTDGAVIQFQRKFSKKDFLTILKIMKKAGTRYVKIKNKYVNLRFKSKTVLI